MNYLEMVGLEKSLTMTINSLDFLDKCIKEGSLDLSKNQKIALNNAIDTTDKIHDVIINKVLIK